MDDTTSDYGALRHTLAEFVASAERDDEKRRRAWLECPRHLCFHVYADSRVTYGTDDRYTDGVRCIERRGGHFTGAICWLQRGWFRGPPSAFLWPFGGLSP